MASWPLRVGRALDNDVVLHDPHVAAHVVVLDVDAEDRLSLAVGASRNAVRVDEGRAALVLREGQQAALMPLATWHVGNSRLRVRRAQDLLADELPVTAPLGRATRTPVLALAAALLAWTAGVLWIGNNPASTWEAYLPQLLALVGGVLAWAALWGLASKLFTRRFVWLAHLRVVLTYGLAIAVAEVVLGVLAYALDWPWVSRIRDAVSWVLVAAMLAQHLRIVVPMHPRRTSVAVGVMALLVLAWTSALHWQRNDRVFEELYLATLPPPAWRLVGAQPPQALIDDLRALQAPLLETARKAAAKDTEP